MVAVGLMVRPHGLKGHVVIKPETDFIEERFVAGAVLWTRPRAGTQPEELTIGSVRVQNGRPVVTFTGFGAIDDIERLLGQELRIPEAALQPLEPGTYYEHQLAGCEVETVDGERVGVVARVEGGSGASQLVVNGERGEVMVPLADAICVEVDVTARRIRIAPPAGLLELNVAGSGQPAAGRRTRAGKDA